MKSGGTFKKRGRPSSLEQCVKESLPEYLRNVSCSVSEALESSIGKSSIPYREYIASRKIDAVGKGLTAGRKLGGQMTKQKSAELKKYIERHHQELLVPGNFSQIATTILSREARKPNEGWADSIWLNGDDRAVERHIPSHSSLRRIVADIISGKG